MKKQTIKAFTLVELIVVVTILTVLGTIAFISLQGYTLNARNSVRKSDLSLIKKSLELSSLKTSKYPIPDNIINVNYSGVNLFSQGYIGDRVLINLGNLSKKPIDPLFDLEYNYSVTSNGKNYQLGGIFEDGFYTYHNSNLLNSTYAASNNNLISYVVGNYDFFDLVSKNASNCVNITLPSLNINNVASSGTLLNNGSYNFVYNTSIELAKNYQDILDLDRSGLAFTIKEVLNKCSIDNLNDLNTYINKLSTIYQQYNGINDFEDLIYNSYTTYFKINSITKLRKNGITVSDAVISEIYDASPDNIFSDSFSGSDNDELIGGHFSDNGGSWNFVAPFSNSSSYIISSNQLKKSDNLTGLVSPSPIPPITLENYIISFDIKDFAGGQINVYARYIDSDNYYGLKITQNGYQLVRKVLGTELAFGNVVENIPVDSNVELNIYGNNLVLLINDIEKENIIDESISDVGKIAIEMLNQNTLIDNFVLKYK